MEITLAKNSGFCFGVKRAIDIALNEAAKNDDGKKIFTYGPIIHNEIVINDLKSKGIEDFTNYKQNYDDENILVIIRSHGVGPDVYNNFESNKISYIDATCPFVKKIHDLVLEYSSSGYEIIIFGDKNHQEIKGTACWAKSNIYIISNIEEAKNLVLKKDSKYAIFSQTTFDVNTFKNLVEFFTKNGYNLKVFDTICPSTKLRQEEIFDISKASDLMLIIGSKSSSNTKKLYNIAKINCDKTYLIENVSDLEKINFSGVDSIVKKIGIGAGASAPEKIIQEVYEYVRCKFWTNAWEFF